MSVLTSNEVPLKMWRYIEAIRIGSTPDSIRGRLYRGKYLKLKLRRVNKRVILVRL